MESKFVAELESIERPDYNQKRSLEKKLMVTKDGRKLEWIPSFDGILLYDIEEFNEDKIPTIYRVQSRENCLLRYKLKPQIRHCGKRAVQSRVGFHLYIGKKRKYILRYRLIALIKYGFKPAPGYCVDHINELQIDDRPSNLHYVTNKQNTENKTLKSYAKIRHLVYETIRCKLNEIRDDTYKNELETGYDYKRDAKLASIEKFRNIRDNLIKGIEKCFTIYMEDLTQKSCEQLLEMASV